MAKWYSVSAAEADDQAATERLVSAWPDAPLANLEMLELILDSSRESVWAFAPESVDDSGEDVALPGLANVVPGRLVLAQIRQANNLWQAGQVSSAGDMGGDGYVFTPRPLDKTIRGIIRPIRGTFSVG
jgi:hypothetical protein